MAVTVAALVMTGVGGLTVKVSVRVPVPPALLAESVMVLVATVVGVPEITPVSTSRLKPAGRLVAPKLVVALMTLMM